MILTQYHYMYVPVILRFLFRKNDEYSSDIYDEILDGEFINV